MKPSTVFVLIAFAALLIPTSTLAQNSTSFTATFTFPASFDVSLPTVNPCCTFSWAIIPLQVSSSVPTGSVTITNISVSGSAVIKGQAIGGFDWVILVGPSSFGLPTGGQTYTNSFVDPFTLSLSAPVLFHFAEGGLTSSVINGSFDFLTGKGSTPCCAVNNLITAVSLPFTNSGDVSVQMLLYTGDPRTNLQVSNLQLTLQGQVTPVAPIATQFLGAPGSTTNPTASFAEPVNTATGNYYSTMTDLALPGRGFGFVFNRYYNSLDSYSGPLGNGWTHSYNIFLTQDPTSGTVTVKQQDGSSVRFTMNNSGMFSPATPGLFDRLQKNVDGSFTLTLRNQLQLGFSSVGKLVSVTDPHGNAQRLEYNTFGDVISITDTVGRIFNLTYDGTHRLLSVVDPAGRTVSYSYDASGNLASSTNAAGGVSKYTYDTASRMTAANDPRGITYVQNTYDTSGRVVAQKDGRGITTHFAYNTPSIGTTTITDGNGNTLRHLYDDSLRIISITDGSGGAVVYSYDSENDRITVTDGKGNTTSLTYDGNGNVTSVKNPADGISSFTYDVMNDLVHGTDPGGHTTTLSYNGVGDLIEIRDALNGTSHLSYDSTGEILSLTNPIGSSIQFSYDGSGNVVQFTDGAGRVTTLFMT